MISGMAMECSPRPMVPLIPGNSKRENSKASGNYYSGTSCATTRVNGPQARCMD